VAAAQVTVAGTALRAFTDASGRFALNDVAGATAVLQVRMIGFRARTDTVNVGDTNLRIALDQKALELEQVVVTGTAAATAQREIGNAVSRINAADVTRASPINMACARTPISRPAPRTRPLAQARSHGSTTSIPTTSRQWRS